MNKKVFAILFLSFFICNSLFSQSLNFSQLKLRSDIKTVLTERGYAPSIESDGVISFKKNGNNYLVSIEPALTSPLLITIFTLYNLPGGYDPIAIRLAASNLNVYKGIKVLYYPDGLSFQHEMFLTKADQFNDALDVVLEQMEMAAKDFVDECKNAAAELNMNTVNTSKLLPSSSDIIVNNPSYDTPSSNKGLKITKVEVSESNTRVFFLYTNFYTSGGWCSISADTYIRTPDGKQYKMIKAVGIPISPNQHDFARTGQTLSFYLDFPSVSQYYKFDLIESVDSSWKFYDIKIK